MDRPPPRAHRAGQSRADRRWLCPAHRPAGARARHRGKSAPRQCDLPAPARHRPHAGARQRTGLWRWHRAALRGGGLSRHPHGLGKSRRAPPRMAARDAPSAAARARTGWQQHRPHLDQHRRLPEIAAPRPWRHEPWRLSRLRARPARASRPRDVSLCQRRGDLRFPPRPLQDRRRQRRRQRVDAPARSLRRRHRGAECPVAYAQPDPRPAKRARCGPAAPARSRRRARAGEETAQIQSLALGGDGPRRHRRERRLPAHLRRHRGQW